MPIKPKTILVTGCAGFIGGNFVTQFKKLFPAVKIVGIDNFSTSRREVFNRHVGRFLKFYEGSILDAGLLEKIFSRHKPEFVFHFAAMPSVPYSVMHPQETAENNTIGTIALLQMAKKYGTKRLIFSSSSAIYGKTKQIPTKESCPHAPESPYAAQKYGSEIFCRAESRLSGLETVCLRYFNVFGPGQYAGSAYAAVIPAWLETIFPLAPASITPTSKKKTGFLKAGFLEGDGEQTRDFCFIDNVVSANILAMKSKEKFRGNIFNIGTGKSISLNETRKMIEKIIAKSGSKLTLEKRPARIGDIRHSCADISKARKFLGYKPKIGFAEGLNKTVRWFETRQR